MRLPIDSDVRDRHCHPKKAHNKHVVQWLTNLLRTGDDSLTIDVPEICDYELRRKSLCVIAKGTAVQKRVDRLDDRGKLLSTAGRGYDAKVGGCAICISRDRC